MWQVERQNQYGSTQAATGQWGYYIDSETGPCLLENRYYDAGTGRFPNRDLIGHADGTNVYEYAGDDPVTEGDPSGGDGLPSGAFEVAMSTRWTISRGCSHRAHHLSGSRRSSTTPLPML
jgi:RHS repeat-associated protein